jgi:hypothetical protein
VSGIRAEKRPPDVLALCLQQQSVQQRALCFAGGSLAAQQRMHRLTGGCAVGSARAPHALLRQVALQPMAGHPGAASGGAGQQQQAGKNLRGFWPIHKQPPWVFAKEHRQYQVFAVAKHSTVCGMAQSTPTSRVDTGALVGSDNQGVFAMV